MALEANFTSVSSYDFKTLHIVDTSTPNYGSEIIERRTVIICDANGSCETFEFPIVDGVGDVFNHPMTKDQALVVELRVYPLQAIEESDYVRTKNLLIANRLLYSIAEEQKRKLHLYDTNCSYKNNLGFIERATSFVDAAKALISSDVLGAQEALDLGNDLFSTNKIELCR